MSAREINVLVMATSGVKNDGITSWIKGTYGAMDLTGMKVESVAFDEVPEAVIKDVESTGVKVHRVPNRQKNPRDYARAFSDLLNARDYDVLHMCCSSSLCSFELREARKRVVGMRIAHSHNTMCAHRVADRILRPILYREATDFYACGTDAGRWLFGNRPFTVIPNGKELGSFAFSGDCRADARSELGLGNESIVVGHVGRFNDQKNHGKLLEVFASLRTRSTKYELVLIGDGGLFEQTKEKARALGVVEHVKFLGRRADVSRLLNGMDCMVFPSLYEGFPNVVLEWQLNGLPVVMSDTITDECAITPLVSQVGLDASAGVWADAVEAAVRGRDRAADSASAREAAKAGGYDINENAAMLRRLYLEGVERCR